VNETVTVAYPCHASKIVYSVSGITWITKLNKGGPSIELPSLCGTRVHAERLLMTHPGETLSQIIQ